MVVLSCRLFGLVLCLLFALSASASAAESGPAEAIRGLLDAASPKVAGRTLDRWPLARIYQARDHRPIWLGTDGGARRAGQLVKALGEAEAEGLDPGDYAIQSIAVRAGATASASQAELELLITSELLSFASDLRHGRPAVRAAETDLHLPPGRFDAAETLATAASAANLRRFLAGFAPRHPAYRALRRHLSALRHRQNLSPVPSGKPLEEGMAGRRVLRLHARLLATGDLTEASDEPEVFDFALAEAVQRFQSRHDLETDGVAGGATLRAINRPLRSRIQQVLINMERLRWLPDEAAQRAIIVNLAGFELTLLDGGWPVLTMPVVVGKLYRSSPMFGGDMTYLELNPTWTVPTKIAASDYLPKLRRDPSFLREQGFRLLRRGREVDPASVNWHRVSAENFPYLLRQDPGPQNALGRIKFMFPNRFAVYLHDSPADRLFSRRVRTFSSGCIRLADPMGLAAYLLKDDPRWSSWQVEEVMASGETTEVPLRFPIPVYLNYTTLWLGEDGAVQVRRDIYGRDARMGQAMFGRSYKGET